MAYLTGAGFWAGRTGDGPGAGARAGAPTGGGGSGEGEGGETWIMKRFGGGGTPWDGERTMWSNQKTRKILVLLGKNWYNSENFGVTRKILESLGKFWSHSGKSGHLLGKFLYDHSPLPLSPSK